ncbi:MAG: SLBB domain-containing protein [Prevotella sp.]|nr:SLBB domain-containing protein [Prevotella sp.]
MNKFVLTMLFILSAVLSHAQGMSDAQVMRYIQREVKAGTSQSQIAVKLMQRGVDMKQLQRVRQQVTASQGTSASKTATASGGSVDGSSRLRRSNGSVMVDAQGNPLYSQTNGFAMGAAGEIEDIASRPNVYLPDSMSTMVNGKHVFGRDIFNRRMLTFEPNMNIATPANYVVGAGDRVIIDVFGASQKSEQLEVSPDGTITVEGFGPIHLAGLTVSAANEKIKQELGQRYKSSNIRMTVGQTRTISVNVMGEVTAPGTYTLSAFATVFHAIYMAGGVTGVGTLRSIKVYRGGRQLTVVDVYDYILNGKLAGNVRLADNDVIVVGPYDCLVDISGQVKRPMAYEMRKGESLATLLKYAGGFTSKAYKKGIQVNRVSGEQYSAYNVQEFDISSFKLMDGDSVTVDSILERYANTVQIKGAVFHPGMFDLGGTNNTVRSLIESAGGLTEDAFTAHAVLHRMKPDRVRKVLSVDIEGIMAGTIADMPLKNEDILFIPFRSETLNERTLTIHGEVQMPGIYEYAEDETVEDFILQAGGLTDAASTARVDVSRRISDPGATQASDEIANMYSFVVKNGMVVDGDRSFTLEPYDEVYVRRSPAYQPQRNVLIEGEVLFPGNYALTTKNQRISELVKAAGGVTDQAYVRGARIERVMTEDEKFRNRQVLDLVRQKGQNAGLDMVMQDEEAADYDINQARDSVENDTVRYSVGIELDKALANPGSDYDVTLKEGDRLIVPEYNGTVKINGNVMYPNTVAYSDGKKYKWYVNQAGGFGSRAKKSRTFVVYQNGTVSKAKKARIEPGCEIIVPSKTTTPTEVIGQIGAVGTSMATLLTLLISVVNLVK